MPTVIDTSEASIFSRVIQPEAGGWPAAASEAILGISFGSEDREQMTQLLEKAKAGELGESEANALTSYQKVGRMLELMKSRARRSLQSQGA